MAESLPLIPEKESGVCGDVRGVLREVFRELACPPPPLPPLPEVEPWIVKYTAECVESWRREGVLRRRRAARGAPAPTPDPPLLQRRSLLPTVTQHAAGGAALWARAALRRSSCSLVPVGAPARRPFLPLLGPPADTDMRSFSIGSVRQRASPAPAPPDAPPPPALAPHVVCVPPRLDFVNFTVGQQHTQTLRLVNVSKAECRVALRPARRPELHVQLCAPRGLALSSGAAADLKVHFRPRDVRPLTDELVVRVSAGGELVVPICCYMRPPLLDIVVAPARAARSAVGRGDGADVVELGARLLGDVHYVELLLNCEAAHAAFFLMTEDAWLSCRLDELTESGSVVADSFVVSPVWWRGGRGQAGGAWCRARGPGLQAAALRVLASTAVARPLHLLADSLYYAATHITLEAHEKDYDICSDDDPACEYYVHLGTAFPGRALSTVLHLRNHSPVEYSYYWSVREWGVCSCWRDGDSESLCSGAKHSRDLDKQGVQSGAECPRVQAASAAPAQGSVPPRSAAALRVQVADVGVQLGTQRAVLMLVLKDIPRESFPKNFDPMIVKTEMVQSQSIPGVKGWSREVCSVVCAQLEVWWEVAPVRFVLDPPVLPLLHSRRVDGVEVCVRATQLFGGEGVVAQWSPDTMTAPGPCPDAGPAVTLTPAHSCAIPVRCPLPALPDHLPETDILTLEAAGDSWQSSLSLRRACATRHPALRPERVHLGTAPPSARRAATLTLTNDTHQHIRWTGDIYRWTSAGSYRPCESRDTCSECRQRQCACAQLRPESGALPHAETADLQYDVHAPAVDGCVCTLVQVRRAGADSPGAGPGTAGRASLLWYRVLAPRLVLRVLPCRGDHTRPPCSGCNLDVGEEGGRVLRPGVPLVLGRGACCRLHVANTTPTPTALVWDPPTEEDTLKVVFIPNELEVAGYGEVEFQVVLEARRVCGRRVWTYRASVRHAYRPLYLLVDTAITGLEVVCEVPLGDELTTDSTLLLRRSQRELAPGTTWPSSASAEELFQEEDRKRAIRAENVCDCRYKAEYIPAARVWRPAGPDDYPPIEIVTSPPSLTRVCACYCTGAAPTLPAHAHSPCLQFKQLPLRTVRTRTVWLRNESALAGSWRACLRRWSRGQRARRLDEWSEEVTAAGLAVQCWPRGGVLAARGSAALAVQVYADSWGVFHDQLLIQVDHVEAIVLDVWVEATGAPLQLAIAPPPAPAPHPSPAPTMWLSARAPAGTLRLKNTSRAALVVHCCLLTDHEYPQDELPFRLYMRMYDEPAPARICPCTEIGAEDTVDGESGSERTESASSPPDTDNETEVTTALELFLAADHGRQEDSHFKVRPHTRTLAAGELATWEVLLQPPPHTETAPPTTILFRAIPLLSSGVGWWRGKAQAVTARLRQAPRRADLQVSCAEVHVGTCALDLPYKDVLRVRKRFRVKNIGCGPLEVTALTEAPWSIVLEGGESARGAGAGCGCGDVTSPAPRDTRVPVSMLPRSSIEMCVEVRISTGEAWPIVPEAGAPAPCQPPAYPGRRRTTTVLRFYDTDNVLLELPLVVEVENPRVLVEPALTELGVLADADSRKTYFTVSHTSRSATIPLDVEWAGSAGFSVWPRHLTLAPGDRSRLYLQYTARWSGAPAPAEGCVVVSSSLHGAGAWLRGCARVRASCARSLGAGSGAGSGRDHTDDAHLLPPLVARALAQQYT